MDVHAGASRSEFLHHSSINAQVPCQRRRGFQSSDRVEIPGKPPLRSLLEPNGIGVEAVATIAEAFERLERHTPDIIISDLHLAAERGEDFYARVKATAELRRVPFVFISSTMQRDAERLAALSAGADRFIVRPIDSARLLAEIEACLTLPRGA